MVKEDIALDGIGVVPVAYIKEQHNINIQIVLLRRKLDANYQKKVQDAVKDTVEEVVVKEDIALDGIGVVPVTYIKEEHNFFIQIVILKKNLKKNLKIA